MSGGDLVTLHHGDCLDVMRDIAAASVDAIVTDPPYGLGFMCKAWDDLPPGLPWAQECLRVLKPGGHMLAFGGTRTWHRLACAVEDAGFEMRDSIAWLYGSGFPKSLNLPGGLGTALKPAFEPIVVARKPLVGTVAANVLAFGTGMFKVDGCRIGDESLTQPGRSDSPNTSMSGRNYAEPAGRSGRWPANVILDESQADALDRQSGTLTSHSTGHTGIVQRRRNNGIGLGDGSWRTGGAVDNFGDSGGASRFFYCAKAPASERPVIDGVAHPTVKPLTLMRWLVRLVTPPGGTVLDPFAGSGTTVEAAILEGFGCIGIEREAEYHRHIQHRINRAQPAISL